MRAFASARAVALFVVVLGAALGRAGDAAAGLKVSPVRVSLPPRAPSTLVTITNGDGAAVRFQVEVFSWEQDESGQMKLEATTDIVFFPAFLVLEPGESGKIRVGAQTAAASSEKTYRLIVEEIPPPEVDAEPGAVAVRTKLSIPIFLEPPKPKRSAELAPSLRGGALSLEVKNTGNVHMTPRSIRTRAFASDGSLVYERGFDGWYVLAGGRRLYASEVPKADCLRIAAIVAEAVVEQETVSKRVEIAKPSCGR